MNSRATRCLVLDSSTIIALAEINMANIMEALGMEIVVPQAVYEEVIVKGRNRHDSEELRDLLHRGKVRVLKPRNTTLVEALHDPLGLGESEAIALAVEHNCTVVLDNRIARLKAKSMGLAVKGTIASYD